MPRKSNRHGGNERGSAGSVVCVGGGAFGPQPALDGAELLRAVREVVEHSAGLRGCKGVSGAAERIAELRFVLAAAHDSGTGGGSREREPAPPDAREGHVRPHPGVERRKARDGRKGGLD